MDTLIQYLFYIPLILLMIFIAIIGISFAIWGFKSDD